MDVPFRINVALSGSLTNIYSPGVFTGGVNSVPGGSSPGGYVRGVISHMRIINTSAGSKQFSLYVARSSGGSDEVQSFSSQNVPGTDSASACNPNYVDWYGELPILTNEYLTGQASTSGLYINIELTQSIVGIQVPASGETSGDSSEGRLTST